MPFVSLEKFAQHMRRYERFEKIGRKSNLQVQIF